MIEALRVVVVAESALVFFAGIFLHYAYRPRLPRELQLLAYTFAVCAFGYALAIGTNALTNAPVTPGLFIALAVCTVAFTLAAAALWLGWRNSRR